MGEDNSYRTYCSYHAFTVMSTPYFVPPPTGQKMGGQNNFLLPSVAEFVSHFQNRGAAPAPRATKGTLWLSPFELHPPRQNRPY